MKTLILTATLIIMGAFSSNAAEYTMSLKIGDVIKFTSPSSVEIEYPDEGNLTVLSIEKDIDGSLAVNIPFIYDKNRLLVMHKLPEGSSMTMKVLFVDKSRSLKNSKPMVIKITIKELTEKTLTIAYTFEQP